LIRRIAGEEVWEVVYEVMNEHSDEYEHEEKPAEAFEFGGLNQKDFSSVNLEFVIDHLAAPMFF
jgi:hypothetical protein